MANIPSLQTLLISWLSSFILMFFIIKWVSFYSKTKKNLPPSPHKLPIIGNFHQLGSTPHRSLQVLSEKHGPIMLLHLGSVPMLVASSSEVAQERQLKSIIVSKLLSSTQVKSFKNVREQEIGHMIGVIGESFGSSVDMSALLVSLAENVICTVALGRIFDGLKLTSLLRRYLSMFNLFSVGSYIPWLSWVDQLSGLTRRAKKVVKEFDEFLEDIIEEHVNNKIGEDAKINGGKDFIDMLLNAQQDKTTGFTFQRDTIKAVIFVHRIHANLFVSQVLICVRHFWFDKRMKQYAIF
ncbi:cytochrome P450 [Artemisia annua]|uniref:Cytochrome P450 n=1 Tax=Artemisia annua TaxID=35608 RepID=A0A2U1KL24_ARTAN|nr:cytochrome P450 [Artemisia annua]